MLSIAPYQVFHFTDEFDLEIRSKVSTNFSSNHFGLVIEDAWDSSKKIQ